MNRLFPSRILIPEPSEIINFLWIRMLLYLSDSLDYISSSRQVGLSICSLFYEASVQNYFCAHFGKNTLISYACTIKMLLIIV